VVCIGINFTPNLDRFIVQVLMEPVKKNLEQSTCHIVTKIYGNF